jgi:uncharacterized membrane protein YccC
MHSGPSSRRPRFLSAALAIAGVVALALAVGFAKANPSVQAGYGNPGGPTTVKISQNAQFISSFQINVVVTLTCSAGAGYSVEVDVQQPQGFGTTTFGSGFTSGQCTGRAQKLAVPVFAFFNSWQLGNAVASATACTAACGSDTKQIHIVP